MILEYVRIRAITSVCYLVHCFGALFLKHIGLSLLYSIYWLFLVSELSMVLFNADWWQWSPDFTAHLYFRWRNSKMAWTAHQTWPLMIHNFTVLWVLRGELWPMKTVPRKAEHLVNFWVIYLFKIKYPLSAYLVQSAKVLTIGCVNYLVALSAIFRLLLDTKGNLHKVVAKSHLCLRAADFNLVFFLVLRLCHGCIRGNNILLRMWFLLF